MTRTVTPAVLAQKLDDFILEIRGWRDMEDRRITELETVQKKNVTDIAVNNKSHEALILDIDGLKKSVRAWDLANSIAGLILAGIVGWFGIRK